VEKNPLAPARIASATSIISIVPSSFSSTHMDKYFANANVPTEANTTNVIVFDVLEAIANTHSKRNTPTYFKLLFIILEFFKLLLSFPFAFPDEAAFPILEVNVFVFDALSGSSKLEFMKLVSFRDTAPPGK
jgi:hypothetical protein